MILALSLLLSAAAPPVLEDSYSSAGHLARRGFEKATAGGMKECLCPIGRILAALHFQM